MVGYDGRGDVGDLGGRGISGEDNGSVVSGSGDNGPGRTRGNRLHLHRKRRKGKGKPSLMAWILFLMEDGGRGYVAGVA